MRAPNHKNKSIWVAEGFNGYLRGQITMIVGETPDHRGGVRVEEDFGALVKVISAF